MIISLPQTCINPFIPKLFEANIRREQTHFDTDLCKGAGTKLNFTTRQLQLCAIYRYYFQFPNAFFANYLSSEDWLHLMYIYINLFVCLISSVSSWHDVGKNKPHI